MSCQQVRFALANCVVEINPEPSTTKAKTYTAFLSLVENDGSVVRPLVSSNGRRVRIRAASEPLALHSAISYLRARFGAVNEPGHPCSLGAARVGRPVPIEDWVDD
jgi:hypothetical protein